MSRLTHLQQRKIEEQLMRVLRKAKQEPQIESFWEPNLEITVGRESYVTGRIVVTRDKVLTLNGEPIEHRSWTPERVAKKVLESLPPIPRKRVCIWLDDERDPADRRWNHIPAMVCGEEPHLVLWAQTMDAFQQLFLDVMDDPELQLMGVCFDNDLGLPGREGRHAFTWMEELVRNRNLDPFNLYAQTDNGAARVELTGGFRALERFWQKA